MLLDAFRVFETSRTLPQAKGHTPPSFFSSNVGDLMARIHYIEDVPGKRGPQPLAYLSIWTD